MRGIFTFATSDRRERRITSDLRPTTTVRKCAVDGEQTMFVMILIEIKPGTEDVSIRARKYHFFVADVEELEVDVKI